MKKNKKEQEPVEDGQEIFLDLKAIDKFINYSDTNISNDIEILDTYDFAPDGKLIPSNRSINSKKINSNPQIDNIRYDLVKTLILTVFDSKILPNEDEAKLGEIIAMNTLKRAKMLKIK